MRHIRTLRRFALGGATLAVALAAAACGPAAVTDPAPAGRATPIGDAETGRELAEDLCGRCHATGDAGESPVAGAPTFRSLARKWPIEYLAESLAEGIVTSHRDDVLMPEFVLSPEQIDDLLAYLGQVQE